MKQGIGAAGYTDLAGEGFYPVFDRHKGDAELRQGRGRFGTFGPPIAVAKAVIPAGAGAFAVTEARSATGASTRTGTTGTGTATGPGTGTVAAAAKGIAA